MKERTVEQLTREEFEEIRGSGVTGEPDDSIWLNQAWKCSRCKTVHRFDSPAQIPAPCMECGGIAFETIDQPLH